MNLNLLQTEFETQSLMVFLIPKTISVGRYNDSDTNLEGVNEFSLENFAHNHGLKNFLRIQLSIENSAIPIKIN